MWIVRLALLRPYTVMVAAFKKLGVEVRSSFYAGVNHNSWDRAYREEKDAGGLAAWLLAQRRKTP